MNIYYVVTHSIVTVSLIVFSITISIKFIILRRNNVENKSEIKRLSAKIVSMNKQIIIKSASLKTSMENVEFLKKENSSLKSRIEKNNKKVQAISDFIGDIKKT